VVAVIRRYLTILTLAMWMGGFTFYAEIVIPTASVVLGSHRQVGFITQQVTFWLNLIGLAALAVFLWNLLAEWHGQPVRRRRWLACAWITMLLSLAGLLATHPFMDHLLDAKARGISDFDHFENLHTVYITIATIQWIAALVYLWHSLRAWHRADQQSATVAGR
jgi:uncharacterized membrane protein